jgi:hypothetical protein
MLTCRVCKQLLPESLFSKDKHASSGLRSACKTCSKEEFRKYKQTDAYHERLLRQKNARAEEKQVSPRVRWAKIAYGNAARRAKKAKREFTLTLQQLIDMAPTHCPLLNVELDYAATVSAANSASIDRIDSTRGYTHDNCKVISFKANRIKTNATLAEIVLLAKNMQHY